MTKREDKEVTLSTMMSAGQLDSPAKIHRIIWDVVQICKQSHNSKMALVNIGPHSVYVQNMVRVKAT